MMNVKLCEVLHDYENGKFKDGDMFLYQNNPRMIAILNRVILFGTMTM